ncbi:MAG: hypothetical protein A3H69_05015 [Candidatus Sungbacteria bacterium RIFCSPLOWO2_02_FULL_47_9]|uniref:Uncharacterized protein n=1 Tax=Candidatus Sungbacteria bacterium RIFCSPHIGHO2_01_FULL_47_32 TaxID=1802264 RepID=A0A1G2K7V7_9BACT|nr:MAG: hypothetical protein UX72_C0006G0010 [Parcubacteria group bacterium GW2011_GWA2_47_10]OGZ94651.1 MAG: hypothetical protein A2633_01375 [Candidatus Sungbacteria bacterium RIFCSPHIGHO2_01_FULL_47_32]OGZ98160.1 MAG: hypothetical protein A3D57_03010 [Candidatus Sungbacteria bacterium RIFCSPHIGHO2_02_FULL_46_12]OHA04819.1 MAG: hypothetical protein A3A28_04930 [Candidatus Sungbacteria bacterium RIFCSPLOWO2_01_FULL_47_32]OHA11987.1 MAG: hypothetical protein A3H69_05015 [Candidatus Sungbacteria
MPTPNGWVSGDVIIFFKKNISEERIKTIISEFWLQIVSSPESPGGMYWLEVPPGTEQEWISRLNNLAEVDQAYPNKYLEEQ